MAALETTIVHCANTFKNVYITGDLPREYEIPNLGAVYVNSESNSEELKLIIPVLAMYNISLGFGGGSHLPVTYGKTTLCMCNHWGFIYPNSMYLTSTLKNKQYNSKREMVEDYVHLTSTLTPKELNKLDEDGDIIPPQKTNNDSHKRIQGKGTLFGKGYIYGDISKML